MSGFSFFARAAQRSVSKRKYGSASVLVITSAWLFANMQGQEGLDEWVLTPGVKEDFGAFMQLMQQFKQTRSASVKRQLFDKFGKTYYFEYFFLKDITYY